MKQFLTLAAIILFTTTAITTTAVAQDRMTPTAQETSPGLFTTSGGHEIGLTLGVGGRYTTLFGDDAATLDLRGAFTVDRRWVVGLTGSAFNYDHTLSELVDDGSYRFEAAYGGLFVERWFGLGDDVILSLGVATGYGEAVYRYDKDFRTEKLWTEETIDRTEFAFFEPSIGLQVRVAGRIWLGAVASYRNTSPVQLLGTPETVFQKWSAGLQLGYGLF